MTDIPSLLSRVRTEMGDVGRPFLTEFTSDGVTTSLTVPEKPLKASTLVTQVATSTLTQGPDYTVDEGNGVVALVAAPSAGALVTVGGTAYRYFTDADWTAFLTTALDQHLHNRVDELGQPVILENLPEVEEYPVVLLTIAMALQALLNDASFDVDIHTPEGVSIPRGQRVEQLWHMWATRIDQYNKLCAALNVGLFRIEQFDLRRKSYMTNRLVPVYQAQEVQDSRFPRQIFPEIPTDGVSAQPVPIYEQEINLVAYSNQDFTYTVTLGSDVSGLTVRASVRRYPYNLTPLVYMDVEVLNAATGQIRVSVTGRMNYYVGVSKFWDLQTIDSDGNVTTHVGGTYNAVRQGGPW